MADAFQLLEDYIAAHRADDEADPLQWVDRADGRDRDLLAELIDSYLERAPGREWDAEGFKQSGLAVFAERVNESLYSQAGTWPVILPSLREQAEVKRSEVVSRLAQALGAESKQTKVGAYYHGMEQGSLPAEGVDDSVLSALGSILGASADALRRAGRAVVPLGGTAMDAAAPAFARTAEPASAPAHDEAFAAASAVDDWDEVDRLFRGG